ncbi:MAG: DUF4153 domain-containing protein [Prevotellaceae bacterium]|jgi:hypothetical protein|nr:DUF4153 domain-containing protein [Prevotellaceae bacterium]
MKTIRLRSLQSKALTSLQTHPVEAVLGLCFFVLYVFSRQRQYLYQGVSWQDYPGTTSLEYMQWFFPVLFVVSYCANSMFRGKWRPLYYASFLPTIPLFLLRMQLEGFCESTAYQYTLLLAAFLLLGHRRTDGNVSFARNSVHTVINVGFSFLIGMLLMLAVNAIYHSVVYIFDWSGWSHFTQYTFMVVLYLVIPLLFCYLQQEDEEETETDDKETLSKTTQIVVNFILSPGVIAYTGILYLYFLTILIRWELPKGGIAYMVMAFIFFTLAGRMSQLIVTKRYYDWFYRPFSYLAIPPLILFWIGTIHRIAEYSFTEARVYLLASGVLMTLYVFFLLSKRLGSYRLMLLVSAVVIAVLTYIPAISAKDIGIAAQEHRLETLARSLSLWNDSTARLTGTATFKTTDSLMFYRATQLVDCYDYLQKMQGKKRALALYGANELELPHIGSAYRHFSYPSDKISIEGYKAFLSKFYMRQEDDGLMYVRSALGEQPLLKIDLDAHYARYKKMMDSWDEEATDIAPFCFENDSCLMIYEGIIRNSDGEYSRSGEVYLFLK